MNTKSATRLLLICFINAITISLHAQSYPDISGTWFINNDPQLKAEVVQNGQYLTFTVPGGTSKGYFHTGNQIFASEWNTYAALATDGNTLTWDNQTWRRAGSGAYPDISGVWYINGDKAQVGQITQSGQTLSFKMGSTSAEGYFTAIDQLFAPAWNAYANVSADRQTITWGNQIWKRSATTVIPSTASGRFCRLELSTFYYAAQSLGAVWGRSGTEPAMPTPEALAAMEAHLLLAINSYLEYQNCLGTDLIKLNTLRNQLRSLPSAQITRDIEIVINELQAQIINAPFNCDYNVDPIALFVGGVHLGAAQAWASAQQCRMAPMPAAIATVISNHLNTAQTALTPYAKCLEGLKADKTTSVLAFDFGSFARVPLASANSIEAHTFIVGIETQLLWAIGLSDCCCNCNQNAPVTGTSACDATCRAHCIQKGFQNGRFNGKTVCLLGVVSGGNDEGCDCW